jgi:hypothetical protein
MSHQNTINQIDNSDLTNMLTLPVKVADHYKFSVVFFVLGFILTCWFLLYVVSYKQHERKLFREFILALFASIYLGFGSFFLMLSFGVNV